MKISATRKIILLMVVVSGLSACGGGGGDDDSDPSFGVGVFRDTGVSGFSHVSGSTSGVTALDGSFIYEVGESASC